MRPAPDIGRSGRPVRGARPSAAAGGARNCSVWSQATSRRTAKLAAAIGCSAAWLPGRERTKTNCIRLIHEMRMSMREIGRRMVERGAFDEIEDFGFVRAAEIDVLLDGDASTLTPLIRERRAEYHALQAKVPPFVFVGSADGPDTWPDRGATTAEHLDVGDELRGLPGCPGVAEGRARVILDSNDPIALEPGDVLVAPITDPSWTPLFVPAAAVVVDVGAALSHAIIVSRELGIPCVVSATDATRRIPDGALVRVDGEHGPGHGARGLIVPSDDEPSNGVGPGAGRQRRAAARVPGRRAGDVGGRAVGGGDARRLGRRRHQDRAAAR